MEADENQCKFPRINDTNGRLDGQYPDDEDEGDNTRCSSKGGGVDLGGGLAGRFYGWPSSRIVRVSRASGGKDRHSKVLTSKGLRDRRVRLSVNTAIQFYDLQDRLGCDQPSKAVEWLLKAASSSIAELPPINSTFPFPDTPKQSSTAGSDQLGFDSAEADPNYSQQHVTTNTKSSACSSTSETSKGSGLSLSRSESRMKARERAKERVALEKEKESESASVLNPISQTSSFTELLSGGINNAASNAATAAAAVATTSNGPVHQNHGGGSNESDFFLRSPRQWAPVTPMDYLSSGLLGQRSGQMHMSTNPFTVSPLFNVDGEHHQELLHFSFVPDHLVNSGGNINSGHTAVGNSTEYNLNFRISSSSSGNPSSSSGLAAGFNSNRGTLQSNSTSSPSLSLPHLHRLPDGSAPPSFFISPAADRQNHHPFLSGLQLCYEDDGSRHSAGQKGKGKN